MKRIKKALLLVLTVALASGLLTACAKKKDQKEASGGAPMGRYVESSVPMPEPVENGTEIAIGMLMNPQKQLEIFTAAPEGNDITRYILEGETWSGEKIKALAWGETQSMDFTYGPDGLLYYCRFKMGDDGNIQENKIMRLNKKGEEQPAVEADLGADYVRHIQVYDDNRYIVSLYSKAILLGEGGDVEYNRQDLLTSAYAQKDLLLGVMGPNYSTVLYDLKTGKEMKEINTDGNAGIVRGDGENWYLLTKNGLHRMALNGNAWETLVDGKQNSMSKPSLSPEELIKAGDEFYVMYQGANGKRELMKYAYDPNMPSRPDISISVVTIKENEVLRQAAVDFQKQNPNVSIDIRIMDSGESGQVLTDQIKAINTELLAGKGADIIITDQMPVDSFIEKGVLEDLSPLVNRLLKDGRLSPSIADSYKRDGAYYTIPLRIGLPFYFGQEEALAHTASLETLSEAAAKEGTKLLGDGFISRETLIKQLYHLYGTSLYDEQGAIDEKAFTAFLEQAKTILDSCNAKVSKEDSTIDSENTYNVTTGMLYGEGALALAYGELENLYDTIIPWEFIKEYGGSYTLINGKFIPYGLVGLNHASGQKELAEQFIEFMFSGEIQSVNVSEGFSVNPSILEGLADYEDDFLISVPGKNGENIDAVLMDKKRRNELISQFEGLKEPVIQDLVFEEMLVEGTQEFFAGTKSVEETLQLLMGKMKMYLTE